MTNGRTPGDGAARGSVTPGVALIFATVGFLALLIFGLGVVSLALDESIIETPGLGPIPGVVATTTAIVVFAATLWAVVRRTEPSFWNAIWIAAAVFLGYLGGLWIAAILTGVPIGVATGVSGRIAMTWFGVVIAGTALVTAWAGIALVRTRARRPRWPWEPRGDE